MTAREIITLQLGNYANYVGTHWWNIQESSFSYDPNAPAGDTDHDTLFREGRNARGDVTYTPRLLLVDLKGALKHLPRTGGDLYGGVAVADIVAAAGDAVCWDADGQLDVVRAEVAAKPRYQQELDGTASTSAAAAAEATDAADDDKQSPCKPPPPTTYDFSTTVETWTDFMSARLHPRSINIIDSLDHSPHEAALDTYAAGAALWRTDAFATREGDGEFTDRLRQYAEECNSLQGVQLLWDCADGFGGLAAGCMEHVHDEYGRTVLGVPVFEGRFRDFKLADTVMSDSVRVVNIAMSYANALANGGDAGAALLVPLAARRTVWRSAAGQRELPLFGYAAENAYESAAVLATYLDTVTLEYRRRGAANTLGAFCASLNNYGRRLAGAAMAMPFKLGVREQLIVNLDKLELDELLVGLSPNTVMGSDRVVQHVSVRGVPEARLKEPLRTAGEQMRMAAYGCGTAAEMLQLYFQCSMYASLTHVRSVERGMTVRTPFPVELFDERVRTPHGWWEEWPEAVEAAVGNASQRLPGEVPVLAAVRTSCDLARTVETLHREAARVKLARLPRFAAAGLEADEYAETLERLLEFMDNYDDAFEL